MALLTSRRLAPMLVTQALGAINDNLVKNAIVVLILLRITATGGTEAGGATLIALAGGILIAPYVLLSATAGQIADRFEKSRTVRTLKLAEVALMLLSGTGFILDSLPLLFAALFGLGTQAAFFSPLKYAILPNHLAEDELVAGNGLVEAGTFLGILAGTIAGSVLIGLDHGGAIVAAAGLVIALAGVASAAAILPAPSSAPDLRVGWNIVRETTGLLALARANRPVWLCLLGLSWFWVVGATLMTELPTVVQSGLHATPRVFTLLLLVFSIGVGTGSVLCARLLHGEVTPRLVPFVGLGLSVFLWDFGHAATHGKGLVDVPAMFQHLNGWRMMVDLALLGACGGLYSVPLYAVIQDRSPPAQQARMVAANNVVNAVAMVVAAGVAAGLAAAGMAPATVLLLLAVLNALVALWIMRLLPASTVQAIFRAYFHLFHGVTIEGADNIPPSGRRTVFVVNHQSFYDGAFVAAFLPGAATFAVNVHIARKWWAKPFLAAVRIFPVDPVNPYSAKTMVEAARAGTRLVIFPEGRITTTGALMKVYEGAGMVADRSQALLVPIRIDGLTDTKLSRLRGRIRQRWFPPLRLTVLPPITIGLDPALLGRARRKQLGAILQGVMEQAAFATANIDRTIFTALLDASARHGARLPIVEDIARVPLTYRKLILGAVVLGQRLARDLPPGAPVGLLLPNANGALVTFLALQSRARTPAMLNVSAGAEAMLAACTAAGVTTVLSSHAFVERAKLGPAIARMETQLRILWLEDIRASLRPMDKLRGLLTRPRNLPGARALPAAPAAILFTSGSEGTPKGVVLSHRNMLANIAQVAATIDFTEADRVFNAMPMFHALGLVSATLLPVLSGVRTFLYPSPLHYRIVPELIYDTDATVAFGTDTFLTGWARFAHPYDFYRMRFVVSGAERVRDETRRTYADRFGVRILEGYGATETAPVLALNTPIHSRPGAAGRLLPGITHRLDPVPGIEHGGKLMVHGPNVMLGYLRTTAPGILEAPEHGWYDTGDIVTIDDQGFVTITARAKRFAKIAGEMVSMPAAEALASAVWPGADHAVVSIPDGRKGEALVLLTTEKDATSRPLLTRAREAGTPEIAVPRIVRVLDKLPMLGSGKVDYVTAARLAAEREPA